MTNLGQNADVEELKKRFGVFGKIQDIQKANKGFTFIQYGKDEEAQEAIKKMDNTEFFGNHMKVKLARPNKGEAATVKNTGPPEKPLEKPTPWSEGKQQGGRDGVDLRRGGDHKGAGGGDHRGEQRGGGGGGYDRYGGGHDNRHHDHHRPPPNGPPPSRDRYDNRGGYDHNRDLRSERFDGHHGDDRSSQGRGGYSDSRGGPPPSGPGPNFLNNPPPVHARPAAPLPPAKPNDVEIICFVKSTRDYAEMIEDRLKNISLSVDVLFPNPDIPIGKVLGNIAMRGVMFAVCVAPENKLHRSLTVNVLQGEQQEHRNMPVDEATAFISRNFLKLLDEPPPAPKTSGFQSKAETSSESKLPTDIKSIIGFLTDDRPMSIMEYDKLIKYLVLRREGCLKDEYGSNVPVHLLLPPVGPNQDPVMKAKQEEIQSKVMDILNKKAAPAVMAPVINPTLQQAIDSLVKTGPNLLNNVGSGAVGAGGGGGVKPGGMSEGYYASLYSGGSASSNAYL